MKVESIHPVTYVGIKSSKLDLEDVFKRVGEFYSVSKADLVGKSRKREIVEARCVIAQILKENNYTLNEIAIALGKVLGNGRGDHSTAIHYVTEFRKLKDYSLMGKAYKYASNLAYSLAETLPQVRCNPDLEAISPHCKHLEAGKLYTVYAERENHYKVRNEAGGCIFYKKDLFL